MNILGDLLFFLDALLSRKDTEETAQQRRQRISIRLAVWGVFLVIVSGSLLLDGSAGALVNKTLCKSLLGVGLLMVIAAVIRWLRLSKTDP